MSKGEAVFRLVAAVVVFGGVGGFLIKGCLGGDQAEHVGNPDVYARISAMSDCAALQKEFDTANANFERESRAGDQREPYRKAARGYMDAADARMKSLGCYH